MIEKSLQITIAEPFPNIVRKRHTLIAIFTHDNQLILGRKTGTYPGQIHRLFGGGVNPEETPDQAAIREMEEETGLQLSPQDFQEIGVVTCQATDSHAQTYQLDTHLFAIHLTKEQEDSFKVGDDVSEMKKYSPADLTQLIEDYITLPQDLWFSEAGFKFHFRWYDYGQLYAPIHQMVLDWWKERDILKANEQNYNAIADIYTHDFAHDFSYIHLLPETLELGEQRKLFTSYPTVDLGTGPGTTVNFFLSKVKVYQQLQLVDISPRFVELLKQTYRNEPRITVIQDDLSHFVSAQKENTIGCYTASFSLNHLTNSQRLQCLQHIQRTLIPNGLLYASFHLGKFQGLMVDPYFEEKDPRIESKEATSFYLNMAQEKELVQDFKTAGFQILQTKIVNCTENLHGLEYQWIFFIAEKV